MRLVNVRRLRDLRRKRASASECVRVRVRVYVCARGVSVRVRRINRLISAGRDWGGEVFVACSSNVARIPPTRDRRAAQL